MAPEITLSKIVLTAMAFGLAYIWIREDVPTQIKWLLLTIWIVISIVVDRNGKGKS